MAEVHSKIIYNDILYWIMAKNEALGDLPQYVVMKKPAENEGVGNPIKFFDAATVEEAILLGCEIAKEHGLL